MDYFLVKNHVDIFRIIKYNYQSVHRIMSEIVSIQVKIQLQKQTNHDVGFRLGRREWKVEWMDQLGQRT